ncbi:hypothetical protein [Candidatus Synechococcus spongiarum]|uniref:hypothetical protein n=1 Tax=Candidatus Synechococcus spongiarum TaxID=431041 RepID=UPI00137657EE|nr:hypothetical protein [Candidatus Synechococcus spongiarum]
MRLALRPCMLPWRSVLKMVRERVIAQVRPRLRHCLEERDRPGILSLTTWLVHRHGHALLQQLLSQPEWSGHRLWWAEQIHHLNLELELPPQSDLQSRFHSGNGSTDKGRQGDQTRDKVSIATRSTANRPAPTPRPDPEPQERRPPLDRCPANPASRTEPVEPGGDQIRITPAQVTKQRLKAVQAAKPAFRPGEDGGDPPRAPATGAERPAGKERPKGTSPGRQRRSRHLRSWLPRSRLPHQDAA